MQRIDFIGAPGIGKSTIYNEMIKRRSKNNNWVTADEAKNNLAIYKLKNKTKSFRDQLLLMAMNIPFLSIIKPAIANSILSSNLHQFLDQVSEEYNDFLSVALNATSNGDKKKIYRLMTINWFYTVYRDVMLIENSNLNGLVIFDESLSQKIYGISYPGGGSYEQLTEDYFRSIPLPSGLIHFNLEPETIIKRIARRNKVNYYHSGLSDSELLNVIMFQIDIAVLAVDVLKQRGVRVLELDAGERPVNIINKIESFIT